MNTFQIALSKYLRANNNRLPANRNVEIIQQNLHYFIDEPELAKVTFMDKEGEEVVMDGVRGYWGGKLIEAPLMDAEIILPIEMLKEKKY
jgi:hypothetical protein